ncbi:hypothetical protein [Mesorhizobium sp. M0771]|uniref:hypothetical protein n=1 Tax=Mesorhizobium sp. M0771 TaxID=2956997 RepID=UPI00333ABB1B
MRVHVIAFAVPAIALVAALAGMSLQVTPHLIGDIATWYQILFAGAATTAIYWLVNYMLAVDPAQLPRRIGEPLVVVVIAAMTIILAPTYIFLGIVDHRIVRQFPDVVSEARNARFLAAVENNADDVEYDVEYKDGPNQRITAKRALACRIGSDLLSETLATKAISLGVGVPVVDPTNGSLTSYSGTAVATGGQSPPMLRHVAVWNLLEKYEARLSYSYIVRSAEVYPEGVPIEIHANCEALDDAFVDSVIEDAKKAFAGLMEAYGTPGAGLDLERLTETVFVSSCASGDVETAACKETQARLAAAKNAIGVTRIKTNLAAIERAHGVQVKFMARSFAVMRPGEATYFPAPGTLAALETPKTDVEAWVFSVLFVVGWCAIVTKSIRFAKERSSDLTLAAIVFVFGVLIIYLLGTGWLTMAINYVFGTESEGVDFDISYLYLGYSLLTLLYCIAAMAFRTNFPFCRYISNLNLFYVVVMSFVAPFLIAEYIRNLGATVRVVVMMALYLLWFGVIYETYYWVALRLKGRSG